MSAAASRMALYSISCESWYALAARYPDHSRHCSLRLSGAVRGWNAVPTDTFGRGCGEIYDFGICFSGSTKGRGTIVASLSPSGVSTVRLVPSRVCSIGSHA